MDDGFGFQDYVLRVKESDGTIHFDSQSACLSVCPYIYLSVH